jgi:hypothetical protein
MGGADAIAAMDMDAYADAMTELYTQKAAACG